MIEQPPPLNLVNKSVKVESEETQQIYTFREQSKNKEYFDQIAPELHELKE
jgi:hypothetical protein